MKSSKGSIVCLSVLLVAVFIFSSTITFAATVEAELQKLHAAAKAEGEVIWQYPGAVQEITAVIDIFRARYPDIKLSVVSIGATSVASRIAVEAAAGKLSMDVATSFSGYLLPVLDRDLLLKSDWVKIVDVDPKRITFDGRFVTFADVSHIWVYNTKSVSKAEAPKTLEDTLHPKWKGQKISIRGAPSGFTWLFPVWKQDKQKAIDYLKRLATQEIMPATRGAEGMNRIATGECPIGVSGISIVIPTMRKGAPLALCPIPAAADQEGLFILKGVRHPNAARFLLAWLASSEGTKAFRAAGLGPSYPPDASPQAKILADNGIAFTSIQSAEDIREYTGPFSETVMKIMGLKPE